mmetsp:Transcript_78539/g.255040  ORF Transcript_78539/g.255040 Transcript_78539/m.255040 type:complete len:230 (-) Transcript_78539:1586-2275(-)
MFGPRLRFGPMLRFRPRSWLFMRIFSRFFCFSAVLDRRSLPIHLEDTGEPKHCHDECEDPDELNRPRHEVQKLPRQSVWPQGLMLLESRSLGLRRHGGRRPRTLQRGVRVGILGIARRLVCGAVPLLPSTAHRAHSFDLLDEPSDSTQGLLQVKQPAVPWQWLVDVLLDLRIEVVPRLLAAARGVGERPEHHAREGVVVALAGGEVLPAAATLLVFLQRGHLAKLELSA